MINGCKILNGSKYSSSGIFQTYLVFIPATKYINEFNGTTRIDSCKPNGMSEKGIKNRTKSNRVFALTFVNHFILPAVSFNEHCLTV